MPLHFRWPRCFVSPAELLFLIPLNSLQIKMQKKTVLYSLFISALMMFFSVAVLGQARLIKKTAYKTDTVEFGVGGTVSVNGAPNGSISIESWNKNEIEVSAEIELQAPTEADLALLEKINGFIIDQGTNTTRIITVGTFDKAQVKKIAKKIPKNLLTMPFRIDYKIKVPKYCDINVTGGKGDFSIAGVDGEIFVKFLSSNAKFDLVGGSTQATIGEGSAIVTIPSRSWRGRFADINVAAGSMKLVLPPNLNAQIDANILRSGKIINEFAELKPRTRNAPFTEKSIAAKSGVGGISLKFTVGDGELRIVGLATN